jgi:hypothetical protein
MRKYIDLPLLHDHHNHVSLYAALEGIPDLGGLEPPAAYALLAAQPRGALSLVKGWRTELLPLGEPELAGLPPLLILNFSLHGYALTPSALPFVAELWPEFAERHADRAWGEAHLPSLFVFDSRVGGLTMEKLRAFMEGLASVGTGSVEDMSTAGSDALKLIASSPYAQRIISWATPLVYKGLGLEEKKRVEGMKLFLDGALGARSAALGESFLGGGEGFLVYREEALLAELARVASASKRVAMHAIGSLAIEQGLTALESLASDGLRFDRPRLEHVQFISLSQARRAKALGVVLSVQPNFNSDSVDYLDRLPQGLAARNDPFRMLIDEAGFVPGEDLVLGSDGMPQGPEYALRMSLFPPVEAQRLSLAEFISGYGKARGLPGAMSPKGIRLEVDEEARSLKRVDS